jgi:hypothetical protein
MARLRTPAKASFSSPLTTRYTTDDVAAAIPSELNQGAEKERRRAETAACG